MVNVFWELTLIASCTSHVPSIIVYLGIFLIFALFFTNVNRSKKTFFLLIFSESKEKLRQQMLIFSLLCWIIPRMVFLKKISIDCVLSFSFSLSLFLFDSSDVVRSNLVERGKNSSSYLQVSTLRFFLN